MRIVQYLAGDRLQVGRVVAAEKKKLRVQDVRGREVRLSPDKVLFEHDAADPATLETQRDGLAKEVDVELLWETATDEGLTDECSLEQLARLYFDADSPLHCAAIFQRLATERVHFRRRAAQFQPRSAEDLAQVKRQQDAEADRAREHALLTEGLTERPLSPDLAKRLEHWLRGAEDKRLAAALKGLAADPARHGFQLLLEAGHLPPTADLPVLQANLRTGHPDAVLAHADAVLPPSSPAPPRAAGFSIDDPDTREVDDVLTLSEDGDLLRVDVDIADVAAFVAAGDPVDREAQRRASTAYLPTGRYFMLPERIGCDLASLRVGVQRPALRTSAWFDVEGRLQRHSLSRVFVEVGQRLDYGEADRLLAEGEGPTAEALRRLQTIAAQQRAERREAGAVSFQRPEWKIFVSPDGEELTVIPLDAHSPSRQLVAEMMILANRLAAERAAEAGVPVIYRVQPPPTQPVPELSPDDPAGFAKLRGLVQPAALSLQPGWHWGLGVRAYTQTTSPLRRYGDLVAQRQLSALLADEPPPYEADALLKVLAHAEAVERELKRTEALVKERWALEAVARLQDQTGLPGHVVGEAAGGYKVMLRLSGAVGLLTTKQRLALGDEVTVDVQRVRPRQHTLRLLQST